MSEWFKEPVLKTGDPERDRGFESHLLRFIWFMCKPWRNTQEAEGAPLERELVVSSGARVQIPVSPLILLNIT